MTNLPKTFVDETHRYILQIGSEDWIDVYRRPRTETDTGTIIAALIPESKVEHILKKDDWGFDPSHLRPGCTEYDDGNVVYYRFGSDQGYEPLVLERGFGGIKPECQELNEEFRLFHNLYFDAANKKYIKVRDDGSEQDTALITPNKIAVHTVEIKQFLAMKEMQLIVLFDLHRRYPTKLYSIGSTEEANTVQGPRFRYRYRIADNDFGEGSIVRIWGKTLVRGFPKEDSGIWPFNGKDDEDIEYTEFVVGTDDKGKQISAPCDPHGGQYLTPVYFRPEVLNRYYDNPTKYSVEDGYLRCGSLWGVEIHNDRPNYVTVFLGDLGRDLPEADRLYWRSFNVPPSGPMSETAYRRSILAEFADPTKQDLVFKQEFTNFQESWAKKNGWPLFKPLSEDDSHCIASLRIPTTGEQGEFDTQVMYLTKILIDSLNEAQIAKEIVCISDQKGISKLEQYLKQKGVPESEKHIQFLRDLQSLRSAGGAHRKSENYEKISKKIGLDTKDRRDVYAKFLDNAIEFLAALQKI